MNTFKISWKDNSCGWDSRPITRSQNVIHGISSYATLDAAQAQVDTWSTIFPFNSYYIEPR